MPMNNPRSGIGSVPEYQMSGVPWVTSGSVGATAVVHEFPNVTRALTITNNSAAASFLLIGFTENGVKLTNNFPLDGGKQVRLELRVRDLWLKGQNGTVQYGVCAELTSIERQQMPYLTSSASPSNNVASSSWVYPGVG